MGNTEKKLTKGMLYVLLANVLTMCINAITNFLLPGVLSVDTYAAIKTFQLYMNYVGVFHLGYVDGVYLKYGGAQLSEIPKSQIYSTLSTLRRFQIVVSAFVMVISIIFEDYILLAFAISIIPVNIAALAKMLYQAVGEFKLYSRITNLTTLLTFLANLLLCTIIHTDNYKFYLISYVLVNSFIWIILEINGRKLYEQNYKAKFNYNEFKNNLINGFALMCGNFASFILTGMDRWFVKFTLDNYAFAQYSFAVSMENMLNLVITPVTVPLYNYLCNVRDEKRIRIVHGAVTLFAVVLIAFAYIAGVAVDFILPKYMDSKGVINLLFAAQGFQIVIKGVFVNLYKVQKQQKKYFIKLMIIIISGALFNAICFSFLHDMTAYALGTLISALLWYFICLPDFKQLLSGCQKDIIFLFLEIILFMVCGLFTSIIGLIIYVTITILLAGIFMNSFIKDIYKIFTEKIIKKV